MVTKIMEGAKDLGNRSSFILKSHPILALPYYTLEQIQTGDKAQTQQGTRSCYFNNRHD